MIDWVYVDIHVQEGGGWLREIQRDNRILIGCVAMKEIYFAYYKATNLSKKRRTTIYAENKTP